VYLLTAYVEQIREKMAKEAAKLESPHEPVGRRQTKAGPKLPLALEQFQSAQASHFL
jgi:hypothetical protein